MQLEERVKQFVSVLLSGINDDVHYLDNTFVLIKSLIKMSLLIIVYSKFLFPINYGKIIVMGHTTVHVKKLFTRIYCTSFKNTNTELLAYWMKKTMNHSVLLERSR